MKQKLYTGPIAVDIWGMYPSGLYLKPFLAILPELKKSRSDPVIFRDRELQEHLKFLNANGRSSSYEVDIFMNKVIKIGITIHYPSGHPDQCSIGGWNSRRLNLDKWSVGPSCIPPEAYDLIAQKFVPQIENNALNNLAASIVVEKLQSVKRNRL